MKRIALSKFARRQTPESEFSHWTCSDEDLVQMVDLNFDKAREGYRDGVCLVPVPPEGFYSAVVLLEEGDVLTGQFKARREGEAPRKRTYGPPTAKAPAVGVDVVLYRHDVLEEDGDRSTDAEWEIISVNARVTQEEQPIAPETLMANHFGSDGGTDTHMSPEEFVEALGVSFQYWSDKTLAAPKGGSQ